MKNRYKIVIVSSFFITQKIVSDPIISLFLKEYQEIPQADRFKKIGKIAKEHTKGLMQGYPLSGIFSSYAGYLQASNSFGQIIFPRRHASSTLTLLITPSITPLMMFGNTIHHWELEPGVAAQLYTMTRHENTQQNLFFWTVEKGTLPANNIIPAQTIILFTKPSSISIPLGATKTDASPNLMLPDIFIKKGAVNSETTFFILNLRHFFAPINQLYKKEPTRFSSQISN